ncbi:MAG: 30S ribosomal protein S27e [Candidatus Aenigmatarchaeota archaeon]
MSSKDLVVLPKSKFLRVLCLKCKNEQVIFNKASTVVKCLRCGEILAEPTGGEARIKGKVLERFG